MKNLKQLQEKYSKYHNGLGHIRWGGKTFYEVNSDVPLQLNSYGGNEGFILNELGQVQLWEFFDAPFQYFLKDVEITYEEWEKLENEIYWNSEKEEELGLDVKHDNIRKWWGLTLDNYYPHPCYPEKEIIAFEVINAFPYFDEGKIYEVEDAIIRSEEDYELSYFTWQCLEYPEFFKPIFI